MSLSSLSAIASVPATSPQHKRGPAVSQIDKDLLDAAKHGLLYTVEDCLKEGANSLCWDGDHRTALILVARFPRAQSPETDLKIEPKCVAIAETLLEAGANVNEKDTRGRTALMEAIVRGRDKMVKILLTHFADPTLHDNIGHTAYSDARASSKSEDPIIQNGAMRVLKMLEDTPSPTMNTFLISQQRY